GNAGNDTYYVTASPYTSFSIDGGAGTNGLALVPPPNPTSAPAAGASSGSYTFADPFKAITFQNAIVLSPSAVVSISATDAVASEPGTDTGTFTITRTGSTSAGLPVYYTLQGTSTSGADYVSPSSFVLIPPGATSVTVVITPQDDTLVEGTEMVVASLGANA